MLSELTKQYTTFEEVDFLRWLQIYDNIIISHSSPSPSTKDKRKVVSSSFSAISSFIESEKTSELRHLLMQLEAGQDTRFCLKKMEQFVFENKKEFSKQGVSKN